MIKKVGRTSKLTPKFIDEAEELVKEGNYNITVCLYMNLHHSTWYRWMSDGENEDGTLKAEFYDRIRRAEAEAEIKAVAIIQEASKTDWKASQFFLERKFNDRWGKKQHIQSDMRHTGQIDMKVKLESMTDEELEKLAKRFDIDE